jgi:hypothetical protein
VVILKEKTNDRYLPIWIGMFEANAIAMRIQGMAPERPITHDLMSSTFGELGISVSRIVVTALSEEVFFARLHIRQDGREIDVDSRPSDAIALAVRFECPIFVASDVLERAGVIPEKEEEESSSGTGSTRTAWRFSGTSSTASTSPTSPTNPAPEAEASPRTFSHLSPGTSGEYPAVCRGRGAAGGRPREGSPPTRQHHLWLMFLALL